MNIPGVPDGSWQWRLLPGQLTAELADQIEEMSRLYGRSARAEPRQEAGRKGPAA